VGKKRINVSLGSIERRVNKNGTIAYRARIPLPPGTDGRRRWKSATRPTEKLAQAWIVEELGRIQRGIIPGGDHLRLRDFLIGQWLPFYAAHRKPSSYVVREGVCRNHIIPALGHISLAKLTPGLVQTFYTERSTHLAPNTVGAIATTLSAALRAAVDWELLHRNPCQGARVPRVMRREPTIWTPEQTRAFLAGEAHPFWHALWAVLIETGMRVGEAVALEWGDVDWEGATLRIERTVTKAGKGKGKTIGPTKTARGRRVVALSEALLALLRQNFAVTPRPTTGPIFPISIDAVYARFIRQSKALGMPQIRLHDLRHGNVVAALEAGVPLIVLSERLGHASIKITGDTYAHVTRRLDWQSAAIIGGLLLGGVEVDGHHVAVKNLHYIEGDTRGGDASPSD
jgi:integrase